MILGSAHFYFGSSLPLDAIKKVGLLIIGWLFIVLGIFGLFLPFLQGILFILIGLAILSSRSKVIKLILKYLEERYPHLHKKIEIWKEKIRGWFKKG
jgi:uncharacterized membrane protein YbaN (DUF454 family)